MNETKPDEKDKKNGSWLNPDIHFMLPAKGDETKPQKFQRFMKSVGFWIMIVFGMSLASTLTRYFFSR